MPEFSRPILSYDDLRKKAAEFLERYHPSGEIPVPIELIAERDFGIDIVPVPGLQGVLRSNDFGVVGFITSDLKEIHVDEWVFENRENRYRFTIAHELGHAVLHRDIYEKASFDSIEAWKEFINNIPDDDHGWLEWQAYVFAGLILVPPEALERVVAEHLQRVREHALAVGIAVQKVSDLLWDSAMEEAAAEFKVSSEVVERRALKDRLRERHFPS